MASLTEWIQRTTRLSPEIQFKLFNSLLIILILWLLRRLVLTLVWGRTDDVRTRYQWRKTSNAVTVVVGTFLVGREWFEGFQSIATFLGLLSAGLAIALKDLVTGAAGWIFIIWRRPFTLGDRIQIGGHIGDVIDLRIFKFSLLEVGNWVDADHSTGRILHLPNGMVLTDVVANYSKGFQYIWNELPVLVTFESNWQKAKVILRGIASAHSEHLNQAAEQSVKEASRKFMIFYSILTPTVYTSVKDCGVMLTIRYLCEPRRRRDTEEAIWEDILHEFAKCDDVDFAYPTQRFYNNRLEGKAGTRPPAIDESHPTSEGKRPEG